MDRPDPTQVSQPGTTADRLYDFLDPLEPRKFSAAVALRAFRRKRQLPQDIERETLLVPLSGSSAGVAIIDRADYDQLMADGLTKTWFYNANGSGKNFYVRADQRNASGQLVGVARLIVGAGPRQVVKYRNRDTRDLTRKNLYIASGNAVRDDELILQDAGGAKAAA